MVTSMKKLAAILSAALLSGCINVMYRTDGTSKNYGPYYCTGIMSASVNEGLYFF